MYHYVTLVTLRARYYSPTLDDAHSINPEKDSCVWKKMIPNEFRSSISEEPTLRLLAIWAGGILRSCASNDGQYGFDTYDACSESHDGPL